MLRKDAKWTQWSEKDGKNALHYLCGLDISTDPQKVEASLQILKLLLESGMDINSIHKIPDRCGFFPLPRFGTRIHGEEMKSFIPIFCPQAQTPIIACLPSLGTMMSKRPIYSKIWSGD
ncbi:hypothetical protein PACILC2_35030 [Paenibacillus cisolokensis]|uniref:Ankyrin n=1 Tax=Paenibacillus cisolokensis TaxID=1658519 RepID=A0ABQ4N9K9_9BACL|nr:hypothetical protein [Paenibacillus cisolokensis]GIQ64935.1 hypothetical protein PACILC2_35030 [Paenibacillus cisolokensis]